jgi:hypothetical protein
MQENKDIQIASLTRAQLLGLAEETLENYLKEGKESDRKFFADLIVQLNSIDKNKKQKRERNSLVDEFFKKVKSDNLKEDEDAFIYLFPYNSPRMVAKYQRLLEKSSEESDKRIYNEIISKDVNPEDTQKARDRQSKKILIPFIKAGRFFRKIGRYIIWLHLVVSGFTKGSSKRWRRLINRDKDEEYGFSSKELRFAHRRGFSAVTVKHLGITKDNFKDYISEKEYYYNSDINGIFRKWVNDRVTSKKVLKPFVDYFPEYYYHIYYKYDELTVISLKKEAENEKASLDDVISCIEEKGKVILRQCQGIKSAVLSFEDGNYFIGGKETSKKELRDFLLKRRGFCIVTEYIDTAGADEEIKDENSDSLHFLVFNKHGDNPEFGNIFISLNHTPQEFKGNYFEDEEVTEEGLGEIDSDLKTFISIDKESGKYKNRVSIVGDELVENKDSKVEGQVPHFEEMKSLIFDICKFIPEIEYFGVKIIPTKDSFKIVGFDNFPTYLSFEKLDDELTAFIKSKTIIKRKKFRSIALRWHKFYLVIEKFTWKIISKLFARPGFRPLTYRKWRRTRRADLWSLNGISLKDKKWAYKHGFLSYRIPQYGITKENYKEFIPDYDFRWLRQINNKYRTWCEDKITLKYILSEYNQFFPEYYYHICLRNGELCIIRLMDCPDYCTSDFDSIFRLVEEKGVLSLKPQSGSQGRGFYRFSFEDGKYYLNYEEATKEEVLEILQDGNAQYLVTEYILQHPVINNIYSGSVNTLRIIVFKQDGITPQIGNAYMRIGSSETGAVDNVSQGGMVAQVDIETGRLFNGKMIHDNIIEPCEYHPDTGTKIECNLPNWDIVKKYIVELAKLMPQLEFFGFDVAITEDGFKIPEINRSPDYPKIEDYSKDTINYLISKANHKKRALNIKD